jgi:hypothetical protein
MSSASCSTQSSNCSPHFIYYAGKLEDLFRGSLTKWHPHNMSRPHFHPNDRYITVISGTWWKGTGTKYDPDSTVPIPAGSFVTDVANGIHYDGAKDEEVVLEIVGMGPATAIPAEVK